MRAPLALLLAACTGAAAPGGATAAIGVTIAGAPTGIDCIAITLADADGTVAVHTLAIGRGRLTLPAVAVGAYDVSAVAYTSGLPPPVTDAECAVVPVDPPWATAVPVVGVVEREQATQVSLDLVPASSASVGVGFTVPPDAGVPDAPAPVTFRVTVPANTPVESRVFLYAFPLALPMTSVGGGVWELVAPVASFGGGGQIGYAYSRGMGYFGGEFFADDPPESHWFFERTAAIAPGAVHEDVIARWRFMPPDGTTLPGYAATVGDIAPRIAGNRVEKGAEMADFFSPDMVPQYDGTIAHLRAIGAGWVQLAPPWDYAAVDPLPVVSNIPGRAEYNDAALFDASRAFAAGGLEVAYRLQVCCSSVGDTTGKSAAWWDAWFASYQEFLVHHAAIATATGVGRIVLSYPNVDFALPGAPGAAVDAEARWRNMMPAVRAAYAGRIGYELIVLGTAASPGLPPSWTALEPIADLFDYYGVSLWAGYVGTTDATQAEIDAGVEAVFAAALDAVYARSPKPQILTGIAAASYDGGAINAIANDAVLSNTYGPESANVLGYDGVEQAMVYQSILRAAAVRSFIVGTYPFNTLYVPLSAAPDWSVRGKAAEGVVAAWYAATAW